MNNDKEIKKYITKSTLFVLFVLVIATNGHTGFLNLKETPECFYDFGFKLISPINIYFKENLLTKNSFLIMSSFIVDFCILTVSIAWIVGGKSWQLIISILTFYVSRGITQRVFVMAFPENFLFQYPGFPSISVNYEKASDFFWSGHVALPLLCGDEFRRQGITFLFFLCLFSSLFEAIMMTSVHSHYTIDVIFGVIIAYYVIKVVGMFIHLLDDSCMGFKDTTPDSTNINNSQLDNKIVI
jgi:hypothetical protein